MRFEWDENKSRINRLKHGMDFDFAKLAFEDPFAISTQDRDVDGEQRCQLIGTVFMRIILVAHVIQIGDEPIIRIISARKATPTERRLYEKGATY